MYLRLYHTKQQKGTKTLFALEAVAVDYTIPNNKRELKPRGERSEITIYYTIPNNKRELKPARGLSHQSNDYTIPNNKRELKPGSLGRPQIQIIPYQTTKGN